MLYASCSRQFVTQCNSQLGTFILGNKPIILSESYRQCLPFLRVMSFFSVEYCGKKQIESGSALSELLSTVIIIHHHSGQKLSKSCPKFWMTLRKSMSEVFFSTRAREKSRKSLPRMLYIVISQVSHHVVLSLISWVMDANFCKL